MAFVDEDITSEEDIALFNSFNFKYPVNKTPFRPTSWVNDRERNAFLVWMGGGAFEIPHFYAFVWNNNVIIFSLDLHINHNPKTGEVERKWEIINLFAPKNLEKYNEEIISMIKEALMITMASPADKNKRLKFIFEFKTEPKYILDEKGCNFGSYLGAL